MRIDESIYSHSRHNEARAIARVIHKALCLPLEEEIIVIDDGSTDETLDILLLLQDQVETVYRLKPNQGKETAI